MPSLTHLCIFPIKSLDGVTLDRATILPSGALKHDREWAIVDSADKFVNAKRTAEIHKLQATFDLAEPSVTLGIRGEGAQTRFHLEDDRPQLERWLSDYFGFVVRLIRNVEVGFPDDLASPGPTLISTATLAEITTWFPDLTLEQVRRRFRTNLEIDEVPAFWEDRLFSESGEPVPFSVGTAHLLGINPCQRCVVPTRQAETGEAYPSFQKTFVAHRNATLPDWVARSRFNHFYRLAINTRLDPSQSGGEVKVGDGVRGRE